jgi:TolB-like protein
MATGERAFGGTTKARLIASIVSSDPISVARLRPEVPERLDWLVRRCLEKDPERRWQSTKDVAIELEALREEARKVPAAIESGPTDCSVAVLPFVNMSPDPDQNYFADGLAEELINALSKVRGLKVIARTSAFSFKGTNASKLGVATIVEGSVRKAGNRLRITAQLIDVRTGHPLWSEVYDRTLDDVFEVQEQISRTIVAAIQPSLLGDAAAPLVVVATTNQKAYELYLRGLAEISTPTREHLQSAEAFLREAIELDPGFAAAHAALSVCYTLFGSYGLLPWGRVKKHAESAAMGALALDPKLAEAHAALGQLRLSAGRASSSP